MKYDPAFQIPDYADPTDASWYIVQLGILFDNYERVLELDEMRRNYAISALDHGRLIVEAFAEFINLPGNSFNEQLAALEGR